jgi:Domain of unknown function (DUF4173)
MGLGSQRRSSFWIKPVLAVGLSGLADLFFYDQEPGSTVGGFAAAMILAAAVSQPALRKAPRARLALLAATAFALAQIEAPSLLGWLLFYVALSVAVLSPRVSDAREDGRWIQRLGLLSLLSLVRPALDLAKLWRWRGFRAKSIVGRLPLVIVPLIGGAVFLALFASANPVISQTLTGLQVSPPDIPRILFGLVALILAWTFLRPRFTRPAKIDLLADGEFHHPALGVPAIGLSLAVFNALFAIENGLDIAFLWSGAPLPKGVTLADYAHQGAYPLIATALLAGLFVLIALRPGSQTARTPWLRWLVVLWAAQNLLLVASSILRTLDYVQAYSLTRLRIAALIWMALVGVGLILICWRLLRAKSAGWLINANLLAVGLVLAACSVVDLGAVAAEWNIRHAREVGGGGSELDLCYLNYLNASALVPLTELETRPLTPAFRDRVAWIRYRVFTQLSVRQDHWRGWTLRGQRRLQRADALLPGRATLKRFAPGGRDCDGALNRPPSATPAR